MSDGDNDATTSRKPASPEYSGASAQSGFDTSEDSDREWEHELVKRSRQGDAEAFVELYRYYEQRIIRYCWQMLRDGVDTEDATQETFAKAWQSLPTLNHSRRFFPWLKVIAHNACIDILRKRVRSQPTEDWQLDLLSVPLEASDGIVLERLDRTLAVEAMSRLAPRYQEVLHQREGLEWSYRQIAAHNGVPVSTVETLLFRARKALRREFIRLAGGGDLSSMSVLALSLSSIASSWLATARRVSAARFRGVSYPVLHGTMGSGVVAVATMAAVAAVTVAPPTPATSAPTPSPIVTAARSQIPQGPPVERVQRTPQTTAQIKRAGLRVPEPFDSRVIDGSVLESGPGTTSVTSTGAVTAAPAAIPPPVEAFPPSGTGVTTAGSAPPVEVVSSPSAITEGGTGSAIGPTTPAPTGTTTTTPTSTGSTGTGLGGLPVNNLAGSGSQAVAGVVSTVTSTGNAVATTTAALGQTVSQTGESVAKTTATIPVVGGTVSSVLSEATGATSEVLDGTGNLLGPVTSTVMATTGSLLTSLTSGLTGTSSAS